MLQRVAGYGFPVVVSMLVRLVALPVTTYFIGPTEFGIFAILLASSAIYTVIASSFGGYILNQHYKPGVPDQGNVIATCTIVEALLGVAGAALFMVAWPWFAGVSELDVPTVAVVVMALSIPLSTPWASLLNVILLEGRAGLFALSQTLAPIMQLAATATALWCGLGVTGLCIGYLTGILVMTACVVPIMVAHWRWRVDLGILGDIGKLAALAIASNVMEAVMAWAERSQLARTLDMYAVGIYAHSQNYRAMLASGCVSLSRAVHPASVAEARAEPMDFHLTARTWNILFLIIAVVGTSAALVGTEIVSFITYGKFAAAGPLIPLWCMILVLQHSARPQNFAMLARGYGRSLAAYKLAATAVGAASLFLTVPLLGILGPVLSVAIKEVAHRAMLYVAAFRRWHLGFYDSAGIAAILAIAAAIGLHHLLNHDLAARFVLCALAFCTGSFFIAKNMLDTYRTVPKPSEPLAASRRSRENGGPAGARSSWL